MCIQKNPDFSASTTNPPFPSSVTLNVFISHKSPEHNTNFNFFGIGTVIRRVDSVLFLYTAFFRSK